MKAMTHTSTEQPDALRLAEHLEKFRSFPDDLAAAAELRRLHARVQELEAELATLKAAQAAVQVPKDWMDHLGFVIDAPADGIWLVIDDTGCQREAGLTERVLWKELEAIRAALTATPQAQDVQDAAQKGQP